MNEKKNGGAPSGATTTACIEMSATHNKAAAMKCTDGSVQFGPQSCYIRIQSPPLLLRYCALPLPAPLYMNNTNVFSSSRLENKISQQDSDPCLWLYKPMTAKPRELLHTRKVPLCVFRAFINARGRASALACRWGPRNGTSRSAIPVPVAAAVVLRINIQHISLRSSGPGCISPVTSLRLVDDRGCAVVWWQKSAYSYTGTRLSVASFPS